jgi:hypothetical protein
MTTASFQLRSHSACCSLCDFSYTRFVCRIKRPRAWSWQHSSFWHRINNEWNYTYISESSGQVYQITRRHIPEAVFWHLETEVSPASVWVCGSLFRINWHQLWRNKPKLHEIAERVFLSIFATFPTMWAGVRLISWVPHYEEKVGFKCIIGFSNLRALWMKHAMLLTDLSYSKSETVPTRRLRVLVYQVIFYN